MMRIWQDFKAWRRGERRVAPSECRGRVYEPKNVSPDAARRVEQKTDFRVKARVIRADGSPDEHYELTEGAENG